MKKHIITVGLAGLVAFAMVGCGAGGGATTTATSAVSRAR